MGKTAPPQLDIYTQVDNARLCAQGHHAWVPWLRLENGSHVTWCARHGCDHSEQYDDAAAPTGDPEEHDNG